MIMWAYSAISPILAGFKVNTLISFNAAILTLPANKAVTFISSHQILWEKTYIHFCGSDDHDNSNITTITMHVPLFIQGWEAQ